MARRPKTGFDRYFDARMKNPAFAADYAVARREIDTVDLLIRALDAAREKAGLTKTDLAKLVGMKPEVVRRLFTTDEPNPTLDTVVKLVNALNCSLDLVPRTGRRTARVRQAALRRPPLITSRTI